MRQFANSRTTDDRFCRRSPALAVGVHPSPMWRRAPVHTPRLASFRQTNKCPSLPQIGFVWTNRRPPVPSPKLASFRKTPSATAHLIPSPLFACIRVHLRPYSFFPVTNPTNPGLFWFISPIRWRSVATGHYARVLGLAQPESSVLRVFLCVLRASAFNSPPQLMN